MNVGNNTDWRQNPSCPDAPFMTMAKDGSSQSGYVYDPFAYNDAGGPDDGMVWRYGTERPCNLIGRYVTI